MLRGSFGRSISALGLDGPLEEWNLASLEELAVSVYMTRNTLVRLLVFAYQ